MDPGQHADDKLLDLSLDNKVQVLLERTKKELMKNLQKYCARGIDLKSLVEGCVLVQSYYISIIDDMDWEKYTYAEYKLTLAIMLRALSRALVELEGSQDDTNSTFNTDELD
jgi:hypothetical protein